MSTRAAIDKVYSPELTPKALAKKAGVPLHIAHTYLGERLFRDGVLALNEQGLSVREIGRELQTSYGIVFRILRGER